MTRGTFKFEVTAGGDLVDNPANVECLRKLWLDRTMIDGDDLGPGNDGDFDHGAWHSACHLVGGGGVRRASDGKILWLEVSHDPAKDEYYASVTVAGGGATHRLDSVEGRALLQGSTLLGFVEGNSVGHISARNARDPDTLFNGWKRQDFEQSGADEDGGKVWEHWCTVRDIRPPHKIGSSVLRAYVSLVAALGDKFVPAVARGRRDYGHPTQLCAMVRAGLTAEASATWDTTPHQIPDAAEKKFLEARPADEAAAAATLQWDQAPRYYMFERRIRRWSKTDKVKEDLRDFGRG